MQGKGSKRVRKEETKKEGKEEGGRRRKTGEGRMEIV